MKILLQQWLIEAVMRKITKKHCHYIHTIVTLGLRALTDSSIGGELQKWKKTNAKNKQNTVEPCKHYI